MDIFDGTLNVNFGEKERAFRKKLEDPEYKEAFKRRVMVGKAKHESRKKKVSLAKVSIQQNEDDKST